MSQVIACPWPDTCPCTHTQGCVGGWLDYESGPEVTTPCRICRPDLAAEMGLRHHARGDNSKWIRELRRPLTDNRGYA